MRESLIDGCEAVVNPRLQVRQSHLYLVEAILNSLKPHIDACEALADDGGQVRDSG